MRWSVSMWAGIFILLAVGWQTLAQPSTNDASPVPQPRTNSMATNVVRLRLAQGATNVFVHRSGASHEDPAYDGQQVFPGDRIRTGPKGKAVLHMPDGSPMTIGELTDLEVLQTVPKSPGIWRRMRDDLGELLRWDDVRTAVRTAAVQGAIIMPAAPLVRPAPPSNLLVVEQAARPAKNRPRKLSDAKERPPSDEIRDCPNCHTWMRFRDRVIVLHTMGLGLWSDAGPNDEHPLKVFECPECTELFFAADAALVGSIARDSRTQRGLPTPKEPSDKDAYRYLEKKKLDPEKEITLRVYLWWEANDQWRKRSAQEQFPRPRPSFSKQERANLLRLAGLLDEHQPAERLLRAEIARELGEFDRCVAILEGFDSPVAGLIRSLAEQRDARVRAIELER
jgi:hypothetical protein